MSRISKSKKIQVKKRADYCCEYCKSQELFSATAFTVDHIMPQSKTGDDELNNLAFSCQGCNGSKYNKTSGFDTLTLQVTALYNPRKQIWSEHFAWSEDATVIIGISPTGRVTVEELKLNREGLINLRKIMITTGNHPPAIKK